MEVVNNAQLQVTPAPAKRRRPRNPQKVRPFTIDQLDKRTSAYVAFETMYAAVQSDCGGADQLSAVSRQLILMFCSMAVHANDLSARGLAGEPIELGELSLAASTLTRLASRIGITRIPRQVDMTLGDLLRDDMRKQQQAQREEKANV